MQELQAQLEQAQATARAQPASTAMVAAPGLALEVTGADGDAAMQDTAGEGHQQELLLKLLEPACRSLLPCPALARQKGGRIYAS